MPFVLNRGGNTITVSRTLAGEIEERLPATARSRRARRGERVFRADLHIRALGRPDRLESTTLVPFDGIAFVPEDVDAYLERLALCTPFDPVE